MEFEFFCDDEHPLCNIYLFSHAFLRDNLFSKPSGASSVQVPLLMVFFVDSALYVVSRETQVVSCPDQDAGATASCKSLALGDA